MMKQLMLNKSEFGWYCKLEELNEKGQTESLFQL